jgi:hypothetical protein
MCNHINDVISICFLIVLFLYGLASIAFSSFFFELSLTPSKFEFPHHLELQIENRAGIQY